MTPLLLVCGMPAAGKSTFCRFLAREHGFAHYELECWPRGWPKPELMSLWQANRTAFVDQLRALHPLAVIGWGFPPSCRPVVDELAQAGALVVWLGADEVAARSAFMQRGGIAIECFEVQVAAIREHRLPEGLGAIVVTRLLPDGSFKSCVDTLREIEHVLNPPNKA